MFSTFFPFDIFPFRHFSLSIFFPFDIFPFDIFLFDIFPFRYFSFRHFYCHPYERLCFSTTVLNGNDFFQRLHDFWIQSIESKVNIQFLTFKIHDLYTNISYKELLEALNTFLVNALIMGRYQRLSIDSIVELTSIVLPNNYFIYQDSIYRFIEGCPLN